MTFSERLASIDLDDDEQLAADLVAPTYKIDSAGRRVVEPKSDTRKRLGRSPDRADAVLMAFAANQAAGAFQFCYRCATPHLTTGPDGYRCRDDGQAVVRRGDLTLIGDRHVDKPPAADILTVMRRGRGLSDDRT